MYVKDEYSGFKIRVGLFGEGYDSHTHKACENIDSTIGSCVIYTKPSKPNLNFRLLSLSLSLSLSSYHESEFQSSENCIQYSVHHVAIIGIQLSVCDK